MVSDAESAKAVNRMLQAGQIGFAYENPLARAPLTGRRPALRPSSYGALEQG